MIPNILKKLETIYENPIKYLLQYNGKQIILNDYIGKKIKIEFSGIKYCSICGIKTNKHFGQNSCYKCFISAPENEECVFHPELCKAHLGIARDMKWAEIHCLQEHVVYLAWSSAIKVGVTRITQIPTRWIDQGATKAIKLAVTPNRNTAGLIEVFLKTYYTDKTSWQKMLKNVTGAEADLITEKLKAINYLDKHFLQFVTSDNAIYHFKYPVLKYLPKISSISATTVSHIESVLIGIKGQYLIFEGGEVFNVRTNSGNEFSFEV